MSGFKSLKWAWSILLLSILSAASLQPAIADSEKLFVHDIHNYNNAPEADLLNSFLQTDFSHDVHIQLPERDYGKNLSKFNSFITQFIKYGVRPLLTAPTLKHNALLIPAMNGRTLIYPFHSFL